MPSELRARRVADRISRELATLLQREVSDPRLAMLTVTEVDVDRELAYATIYVTGHEPEQVVISALEGARGYLRKRLAKRIPMRSFPRLRFRWDPSPDRGARIDELLDRLRDDSLTSAAGEDVSSDASDVSFGESQDASSGDPQDS